MLSTVLSSWPILRRVNTEFSYLKLYKNESVDKGTVSYLKQNVVGMLSFKIGGIVITGTDNIILSSFLGLNVVGMYANYTLIITGIISLMNSVVNSITSSIGNLANAGNKIREKQVFLQFNMLNGLLTFGVGMGLILYFPTFMSGWLGHDFVLSKSVTLFIVLNFFVGQLRNGLINYLNAYGLYWQQRYKSIFEASLNLVVSLALVMQTDLGIAGVLLGTLASYLLIDFIWEPRIVIKNAIDINLKSFYFWYGSQIIWGGLLFYISQGLFEQYFVKNDWFFQMLITALFVLVGVAVFHIIQIFTAKLVRLQTENIWVVFSRIIRR
ncbi:lipopolysaccharide biosynthesis protein [Weissella cibaria]|uniref:lipopolysaccharide biosynthesis protein n=1 Tax=Weissella cibaria TaxID=137591 RepID=UPI0036DC17C8